MSSCRVRRWNVARELTGETHQGTSERRSPGMSRQLPLKTERGQRDVWVFVGLNRVSLSVQFVGHLVEALARLVVPRQRSELATFPRTRTKTHRLYAHP